ncbi:MAG: T9SS type A sorting domain-containing protein [Flavobacteriaceae bacterium]
MKQQLRYLSIITFCCMQVVFAQRTNEKIAEQWIKNNSKQLDIQPEHHFKMLFNRKGPSGETLRYYQMVNDVRVYNAELTIHINTLGKVSHVANSYNKHIETINTIPNISKNEALALTAKHLDITGTITQKEEQLFVYPINGDTTLAYSIKTLSTSLNGYWETIIDAHNGQIISSKDVAFYYNHHEKEKEKPKKSTHMRRANGTAKVFIPEPLSAASSTYTAPYLDNNDATNSAFDAIRTDVILEGIEFSGGQYHLSGPYAEIASLQNPNTGLFSQASPDFHFTRDQSGFEAANTYYHLHESLKYINETLGITLVSLYNGGVVRFDAHAHNGADQSTYGGGSLNFGEGGIDDAECADVILHELGHGLHDWVTNGGLSQVNGLSEGCGDYWAQSYSRSVNSWDSSHNMYNKVFKWDGNSTWNGRRSDVTAIYPDDLVGGGPHTDGQIWATVLMEIYDIIGKTKTDAAFLEGLGMTNGSTNQPQAATAVRQAAMDMVLAGRYGMTCADIDVMTARFNARGYNLSPLDCNSLGINDYEMQEITIHPNPATNHITVKNITKQITVDIYNVIGQRIKTQHITPEQNRLSVTTLSNGIYFLKINDTDRTIKFIKR